MSEGDGEMGDVELGDGGGDDVYEETTDESWGGRLKDSLGGMCVGLLLFVLAFPLLFWNEGRAVARYDALREGSSLTVSIPGDSPVDPAMNGRLVHLTATVMSYNDNGTAAVLSDPTFGTRSSDGALKLRRNVEMYQWKENVKTSTKKKTGGGKTTTKSYSYSKGWENRAINSANFKQSGHENPSSMRFDNQAWVADNVTIGAYVLPQTLMDQASWYEPLPESPQAGDVVDEDLRAEAVEDNNYLYFGSSQSPSVGDTRVSFDSVPSSVVTVVAKQSGDTLSAYQTEAGGSVLLFRRGAYTAESMYELAERDNLFLTWILRLVGFLVMGLGLYLILRPVEVFADVLPILGDIVGCGITFVAFLVAGFLSGFTIAVAWLIYHPVIGIIVLVVIASITAGIAFLVKRLKRKRKGADEDGSSTNSLDDLKLGRNAEEESDIDLSKPAGIQRGVGVRVKMF